MPGVSSTSIQDLVNSTLDDIERMNVTQTFKYNTYGMTDFFMGEKPKSKTGKQLQFDIRLRAAETARFVGMYESTPNTQRDYNGKGTEPWRHIESKIQYDDKEIAMNSGDPEQIYDMLEERWNASIEDNFNLLEDALPFAPTTATSEKSLRGLLYHIRPLTTGTVDAFGGFNGQQVTYGDASTSYDWCGFDRSTADYSKTRNWAFTRSGVVDQTLIQQIRRAQNRTNFRGLPGVKDKSSGGDYSILMSSDDAEQCEDILSRRDVEGNKGDLAGTTRPKIRGAVIIEVAALNDVAFAPIFGVTRKAIEAFILAGRWMKRGKALNDRDQVESWTIPVVTSLAIRCRNPRALWIGHKVR